MQRERFNVRRMSDLWEDGLRMVRRVASVVDVAMTAAGQTDGRELLWFVVVEQGYEPPEHLGYWYKAGGDGEHILVTSERVLFYLQASLRSVRFEEWGREKYDLWGTVRQMGKAGRYRWSALGVVAGLAQLLGEGVDYERQELPWFSERWQVNVPMTEEGYITMDGEYAPFREEYEVEDVIMRRHGYYEPVPGERFAILHRIWLGFAHKAKKVLWYLEDAKRVEK